MWYYLEKSKSWKFHLHFLQLGKGLKHSSCLQSGEFIVVKAAREKKCKKFNHTEKSIQIQKKFSFNTQWVFEFAQSRTSISFNSNFKGTSTLFQLFWCSAHSVSLSLFLSAISFFPDSLQFSGGWRDVLGDLCELQVGAVHYVRLTATLGRTHWITVTGIIQTGVLCTWMKENANTYSYNTKEDWPHFPMMPLVTHPLPP